MSIFSKKRQSLPPDPVDTKGMTVMVYTLRRTDGITKLELSLPDSIDPLPGTRVELVVSKVIRENVEE